MKTATLIAGVALVAALGLATAGCNASSSPLEVTYYYLPG